MAPAIVLALAAVVVALIAGGIVRNAKTPNRTVLVKGYAQRRITSDWSSWTVQVSTRSPQIAPAYAKIESDAKMTLDLLGANAVPREETEVSPISISSILKKTEEGRTTNEIEFYELSQMVTVSSTNVKLIEKVSRDVSSLIKEGVELRSQKPSFFYSHLSDLKVEMLAEAAKDGRSKAARIAESSGAKLSRLVSAQQGIFQITPVHLFEVSDEGFFDTSSIEKMIRAIVTERYAVD